MENGLLGPLQGLDRAADEVFAARGKDLEPDIVRSLARRLDEATGKVKIRLRCRRKRNFDFFVTNFDKFAEVF